MILTSWWSRTTADLPRPFWHLMAATFVNRIGYVVEPFLALYLAGPRQLTPTTIGVVLACFGAGSFVSQILGGYLTDRIGRRATLVTGMVGTAVCFMVLASVRDLVLIAVTVTFTGLLIDIYRPALSAAVADLVPAPQRGTGYGVFSAVYGLAWLGGSIMIGALYEVSVMAVGIGVLVAQLLAVGAFVRLLATE